MIKGLRGSVCVVTEGFSHLVCVANWALTIRGSCKFVFFGASWYGILTNETTCDFRVLFLASSVFFVYLDLGFVFVNAKS